MSLLLLIEELKHDIIIAQYLLSAYYWNYH